MFRGRPLGDASGHALGRVVMSRGVDHCDSKNSILVALDACKIDELNSFGGVVFEGQVPSELERRLAVPAIDSVRGASSLEEGDVIAIDPGGRIRVLFRRGWRHNTLFVTEACNNACVMCSQPPRNVQVTALLEENLRVIGLIEGGVEEIGISGGEPTLLGDGLLELLSALHRHHPQTGVHILSNGRFFYYDGFAKAIGALGIPQLTVGVPLYSDLDHEHDRIVGAGGAFEQAVIGLHNLARHNVSVEVRTVVQGESWKRLPQWSEFVYWNLPFASHVAFMGLEMVGFAVTNRDRLWIDPWEYRGDLGRAVTYLDDRGMNVSVYNHQLCIVPEAIWPHCRRAISEWKNAYLSVCSLCEVREACGGFFRSNMQVGRSAFIRPVHA